MKLLPSLGGGDGRSIEVLIETRVNINIQFHLVVESNCASLSHLAKSRSTPAIHMNRKTSHDSITTHRRERKAAADAMENTLFFHIVIVESFS